jgi:agmatinase
MHDRVVTRAGLIGLHSRQRSRLRRHRPPWGIEDCGPSELSRWSGLKSRKGTGVPAAHDENEPARDRQTAHVENEPARDRQTTGPLDALKVPRYAGHSTFARLPRFEDIGWFDVAVLGVPFDSAVTYRPGARFGPSGVRQASRLLRPYNQSLDVSPFGAQQVVDAGDVACNPFKISESLREIQRSAESLLSGGGRLVTIGGDHSMSLPLLRAVAGRFGGVALVHFDAHLDTWDTYFGEPYTHGTPFRRAFEEGLLIDDHSIHVGIRGPLYTSTDLREDSEFGFRVIDSRAFQMQSAEELAERIKDRVGDSATYVSVDIDVLDPGFAPGTGTPESGGLSPRELLTVLGELHGIRLVSADVVEVAPAYDHAEITGIAASHVVYQLISLMAKSSSG